MRSYQITRYGEPLEMIESEAPVPKGTEVLVEIKACGVCHSDLHYWQGGYELGDGKRFTLAERGINIETMDTDITHAPMSGTPLFTMTAIAFVPPDLPYHDWRDELEAVGDSLNVDVEVSPQTS